LGVAPGRYVFLSVSDTGVGMTPEIREKIIAAILTAATGMLTLFKHR
jgi:signal transduction histidine kinase